MHRSFSLLERGTVRFYNPRKGYGFIVDSVTGQDVFVHFTGIVGEGFKMLKSSTEVEYKVDTDKAGKSRAVDVRNPDGSIIANTKN